MFVRLRFVAAVKERVVEALQNVGIHAGQGACVARLVKRHTHWGHVVAPIRWLVYLMAAETDIASSSSMLKLALVRSQLALS